MPRDESFAHAADARRAAEYATDRPVQTVDPIERGVNALYRIEYTDGMQLVLKAPRYATDSAFLGEPALLDRIGRESTVPVPKIRATVTASNGPLETAYYLLEHLDGRDIRDMHCLSPETQRQFTRAAARHLAEIHELDAPDRYGHLQYVDGAPRPRPVHDTWASLFAERVDTVTAEIEGEGELSDDDPRFADLTPTIRDALAPESRGAIPTTPPPSLVDVPLGGTATAQALRTQFRQTYASLRGLTQRNLFDERYPYYRLYAMAFRLKAFDYSRQFAREQDADTLARRRRTFVADRLDEIQ